MNLKEIAQILSEHLTTMPNAPPIFFDNVQPQDLGMGGVYCQAVLLPSQTQQNDFCDRRITGIYSINVFSPLDNGIGAALDTATQIEQHFATRSLNGLRFLLPQISRVGDVGGFFVYNVSITFSHDFCLFV